MKPAPTSEVLDFREVPPGPPDADLCLRAREGEEAAFRMLFERHAPAVRRFAGNLVRDAADADEVTQETFARAHGRIGRLEDPARFKGWVLGIARIVALDLLGERSRRPPSQARSGVIDLDPTPEAALLGFEATKVLTFEIEKLSADRRAVLLMRLDQELGYSDIAESMGWTLQKVKNEIHRARLQMREAVLQYLRGTR